LQYFQITISVVKEGVKIKNSWVFYPLVKMTRSFRPTGGT
jgi:hypothetical protein